LRLPPARAGEPAGPIRHGEIGAPGIKLLAGVIKPSAHGVRTLGNTDSHPISSPMRQHIEHILQWRKNLTPEQKQHLAETDTRTYTTYAIRDPRFGQIFYVGQTINFAKRRAKHERPHHLRRFSANANVRIIIEQIRMAGLQPDFLKLERVRGYRNSRESETHWINI
jgi:hypothetical protein